MVNNAFELHGSFTEESDISNPKRRIWVVTTAALPWRTGTAVNPLLRALYLTRGRPKDAVTLMVPWLQDADSRIKLYGMENMFQSKKEQETWIRDYCRTRANCLEEEKNLRIMFWDGIYHEALGSIFPIVDICALVPSDEADVAILEEPEHLNWFRAPDPSLTDEKDILGWAHKFRHVIGIIHTNYEAYVKQYGMGTSLMTAPAINALSSLVVRAYCHRVIRLSGTLPSLDARKEVTVNVHGVRSEFRRRPVVAPVGETASTGNAKVYFIGKLIWAKGFDNMLELQERFHQKTGDYFQIDVYGGGNDEESIKRAVFGRQKETIGSENDEDTSTTPSLDKLAASVFGDTSSLRARVADSKFTGGGYTSLNAEDEDEITTDPGDKASTASCADGSGPLSIVGDLSGKTLNTSVETAASVAQLLESAVEAIFFRGNSREDDKVTENKERKEDRPLSDPLRYVPALSRFKWRSTPIPARFMGVKDHIILRDIPEQSIFLNMSTTEVLCTTTAEALLMGKFVVIPDHPSNKFFLQFSNCLAYTDLDDSVDKLQYALSNKPSPLTEEEAHKLSWDGATERLFEASRISVEEMTEWKKDGGLAADTNAARFHVDSSRSSQFVRNLFSGVVPLGEDKQ